MSTDKHNPEYVQLPLIPDEIWKPIPGFEGFYEASDQGRIKRLAGFWCLYDRVLKSGDRRDGYKQLTLSKKGEHHSHQIHKLVARAFLGPMSSYMQVNHKNGDKTDNRLCNLEYVTASQNVKHAFDVLHKPSMQGAKHGMAKLTEAQVIEIRSLYAQGDITQKQLAQRFGVTFGTISDIVLRKNWKHV